MAHKNIRLRILDSFSCTGTECPASCCRYGWEISVDDETYSKWQQLDSDDNAPDLLSSLESKATKTGLFLKHIDNRCQLLSTEGLCTVQQKYGHDFIPQTCQVYPRKSWVAGKYSVKTLNLSCPEVVRLLSLEKNDNLFVPDKTIKVKNNKNDFLSIPGKFATLLDDYVSQVLRNIKYPTNVIWLTISKKIIDIVLLSQQGNLNFHDLKRDLKGVSYHLKTVNNQVRDGDIKSSYDNSGRFWYLVFLMMKMGDTLSSKLDTFEDEVLVKMKQENVDDNVFQDIGNDIQSLRQSFYKSPPLFYRDLMSKYLVVKFLNNAYPMNPVDGNLVAGLLFCLLPYASIQLYVWIAMKSKSTLSEEDVIEIIYSVERKLDHTDKIYQFLSEHPELLRFDTYYSCLVDV